MENDLLRCGDNTCKPERSDQLIDPMIPYHVDITS